jgi:hypothetical protein
MFSNGFRLVCIICPIFIVGTTKSTTFKCGPYRRLANHFLFYTTDTASLAHIYTKPSAMQQYQSIAIYDILNTY